MLSASCSHGASTSTRSFCRDHLRNSGVGSGNGGTRLRVTGDSQPASRHATMISVSVASMRQEPTFIVVPTYARNGRRRHGALRSSWPTTRSSGTGTVVETARSRLRRSSRMCDRPRWAYLRGSSTSGWRHMLLGSQSAGHRPGRRRRRLGIRRHQARVVERVVAHTTRRRIDKSLAKRIAVDVSLEHRC